MPPILAHVFQLVKRLLAHWQYLRVLPYTDDLTNDEQRDRFIGDLTRQWVAMGYEPDEAEAMALEAVG